MCNAKQELLEFIMENNTPDILCALIHIEGEFNSDKDEYERINYILKVGYSKEDYDDFIKSLDFEYDSGYGGQELFGTVRFKDGTRLERGEYDGSEWREYKTCPEIPKILLNN